MPGYILVIDDEPYYLEAHTLALKDAGYKVKVIENARDAFEELKHPPVPDLVVLDLIMPYSPDDVGPNDGMDTGLRLLERIRSELKLSIPIILLTVVANHDVHERVEHIERKFGRESIIRVKPFLPSELVEDVQNLLGRRTT